MAEHESPPVNKTARAFAWQDPRAATVSGNQFWRSFQRAQERQWRFAVKRFHWGVWACGLQRQREFGQQGRGKSASVIQGVLGGVGRFILMEATFVSVMMMRLELKVQRGVRKRFAFGKQQTRARMSERLPEHAKQQ